MSFWTLVSLTTVVLLGFMAVHANPTDNTDEIQCSSGWQRIHRACYMLVTERLSWTEALDHCKEQSGDLTVIESLREKEELEKYLLSNSPDETKFWVGLTRLLDSGSDWRWLGEDNLPLASNMMTWSNPLFRERPGRMCGMIDTTANKLQVASTRCSAKQAFICEYHKIGPRPAQASETSTIAVTDVLQETTAQPTTTLSQKTDNCQCGGGSTSDILTNDASDSNEDRVRRRNQALNDDEELYRRYLQSEIDANNAKVMYYAKVTKLYQDALEKQNQYYSSHQTKLDLEITRLREGSKCT